MDIIISNSSNDPIYLQIVNQIKAMIMSGELAPGDALPSMRNLAMQMRISLITTKRAYDELEREGFLYTVPAKGCFVAPKNTELLREEHLKQIENHLPYYIQEEVIAKVPNTTPKMGITKIEKIEKV